MKDILKYILYTLCVGLIVSCGLEEMDEPVSKKPICKEVEFIARPTKYVNSDVATRASVDFDAVDNAIYSAYFLVYDTNGRLIRYQNLSSKIDGAGSVPSQTITTEKGLENVTVCYIANLPEYFVKENMTDLQTLKSAVVYFHAGTNANPNSNTKFMTDFKMELPTKYGVVGMPSIDPYDTAGKLNQNCLPMFGYWKGNLTGSGTANSIEIQVKRLFSKVTFTIELNLADAYADVNAHYDFTSIVVKNIPKQVTLFPMDTEYSWVDSDGATKLLPYQSGEQNVKGHFLTNNYRTVPISSQNATLKQGDSFTFTFYVPEYIVDPVVDGYEDKAWYINKGNKTRQWYKPLLFGRKTAPYVDFGGILSTKGQAIELDYKIYLGENNFDSFSHKRNYHYKHNVLLYGISNSDECENGRHDAEFAVDHRVNMTFDGFLVGFQRATLLDSHFEVRPLRVKFDDDFLSKNTKGELKVEIVDPESSDWLRLERPLSKGGNTYCSNSTKRKYFTTDLVSETLADSYEISYDPFDSVEGDKYGDVPIWVYVDENNDWKSDTDADHVREAKIRVTYTPDDSEISEENGIRSQEFTVKQRAIYPIPTVGWDGVSRTYGIEYFEEYLYNYDTQDNYGAEGGEYFTDQNGVQWGFDGVDISNTDRALYFTGDAGYININNLANLLTQDMPLYYDFYLSRDKKDEDDEIDVHDYNGYKYSAKITLSEGVDEIDRMLNQQAASAVEYCYNKNKRTDKGKIAFLDESPEYGSRRDTTVVKTYYIKHSTFSYTGYTVTYYFHVNSKYVDEYVNLSNFKWYVPAIDELEDIVVASKDHDFFSQVFLDNLYWSSQPAYHRNYFQYVISLALTDQFTDGVYLQDNVTHARATKYDPINNTFISSDVPFPSRSEGFYKATTKYGLVDPDNTLTYPDPKYGRDDVRRLSYSTAESKWVEGDLLAMTSYKTLDGNDIEMPEGIQPRSSHNRVRCIYNPNPENQFIRTRKTSENIDSESYDRTVENFKLSWSSLGSLLDATQINSDKDIPATLTKVW